MRMTSQRFSRHIFVFFYFIITLILIFNLFSKMVKNSFITGTLVFFVAKFCQYILAHHKPELVEILNNSDENQNFPVIVNFMTLFEECTELGNGLLKEPETYLQEFNLGVLLAQNKISEDFQNKNKESCFQIKTKVFVRLTALPAFGENNFPSNDDIGSFVKVTGTLIKVGAPKLLEYQKDYVCNKCKHIITVKANYERYYAIVAPSKCGECQSSNITSKKNSESLFFKDYQEVKVQEHFGKFKGGTVPHTIWVTLEDDLVDVSKPGDDVIVIGTVMRRWKTLKAGAKYDVDLVLKANNLEICSERKSGITNQEVKDNFCEFWKHFKHQELLGRNHILKSFCPQVFGLYLAKLAMMTVLAGGIQRVDENGSSARGMSHFLLVGDAGTGKSHLLRYASKISNRSIFTTGVGSTNAGLTVSAVRESGDWNLEAGALVLADGGVCCIDDFSSIREHDRTSIHEAMEQQSISVAKAGIVTKLHSRCSIFATTSPKGKYDCSMPMSVNVAISSPLLSRFDIVLLLLDSKSRHWDEMLCNFIFNEGKKFSSSQEPFSFSNKNNFILSDIWSTATFQSYFAIIKQINPIITPEAGTILRVYYQMQRMTDSRNAARTTVRLLESLIRLSQGHARLMFRDEVTVLDAITAISLIESSIQSATLTPGVNALHTMIPEDPYIEYKSQLKLILTKLQLKKILDKEFEKLNTEATSADEEISREPTCNKRFMFCQSIFDLSKKNFNEKTTELLKNKNDVEEYSETVDNSSNNKICNSIKSTQLTDEGKALKKVQSEKSLEKLKNPSTHDNREAKTPNLPFDSKNIPPLVGNVKIEARTKLKKFRKSPSKKVCDGENPNLEPSARNVKGFYARDTLGESAKEKICKHVLDSSEEDWCELDL